MDSDSIEWEKYNIVQRIIFWCFLHLNIVGPIFMLIVTIIMTISCISANKLLEEEKKVSLLISS